MANNELWHIVDENDQIIDDFRNLSESEAETALCRAINMDFDAYMVLASEFDSW